MSYKLLHSFAKDDMNIEVHKKFSNKITSSHDRYYVSEYRIFISFKDITEDNIYEVLNSIDPILIENLFITVVGNRLMLDVYEVRETLENSETLLLEIINDITTAVLNVGYNSSQTNIGDLALLFVRMSSI